MKFGQYMKEARQKIKKFNPKITRGRTGEALFDGLCLGTWVHQKSHGWYPADQHEGLKLSGLNRFDQKAVLALKYDDIVGSKAEKLEMA